MLFHVLRVEQKPFPYVLDAMGKFMAIDSRCHRSLKKDYLMLGGMGLCSAAHD